jgi:hypothetical protein
MRAGRKPRERNRVDEAKFAELWYNRSLTLKQVAHVLGRKSTGPLLLKARELGLPQRREIPGAAGLRGLGDAQEIDFSDFDDEPSLIPLMSGARFTCKYCGFRSETPVHSACEDRHGKESS